jgi:hypothetical protein
MKDDTIETVDTVDTGLGSLEDLKSINSDDALLISMGKAPELRRVYNFWTRMARQISLRVDERLISSIFSMCIPDHDIVQLVLFDCALLDNLRYWRSFRAGVGNVRQPVLIRVCQMAKIATDYLLQWDKHF